MLTDDHDRTAIDTRRATDNGQVIRIHPVTVQFLEIGAQEGDVIERVRALGMTRQLRHLPRSEVREDALGERTTLGAEAVHLLRDVDFGIIAKEAKLVDLRFQLGDGLLEIQEIQVHGLPFTDDHPEPTSAPGRRLRAP